MMNSYQFNSMTYQFKKINVKNTVYRDETVNSLDSTTVTEGYALWVNATCKKSILHVTIFYAPYIFLQVL